MSYRPVRSVIFLILFSVTVLLSIQGALAFRIEYPKINLGNLLDKTTEGNKIKATEASVNEKTNIYFVGDIMLARDVERTMLNKGFDYPYKKLNFDKNKSYVVGNFESSIPLEHISTPNNTYQFSVPAKFIPALKESGFTHLSLANNHSFDHGRSGYNNTITKLWDNDIEPFGHPSILSTSSISVINLGETKIAIIALHTLFNQPEVDTINEVISLAEKISDLQIVYVHWGDEYSQQPSSAQRNLADVLASAGVDIIIGHHPHVVQTIEKIDQTIVFYSLGNFIFDQYFSTDVQQGLMLKLVTGNLPYIELTPVSSLGNRNQPQELDDVQKVEFLSKLAESSDPKLAEQIKGGKVSLNSLLATSSEEAIITQ